MWVCMGMYVCVGGFVYASVYLCVCVCNYIYIYVCVCLLACL